MTKQVVLATLFMVVSLFAFSWWTGQNKGRPNFAPVEVSIILEDGKTLQFKGEAAVSEKEQAYGLMFKKSLADDYAMIFVYPSAREVSFWMKNTLVPVDMLFVRADGTIGRIVSEAQPLDVTPILSQEPVVAVVELRGGMAKLHGISSGDKVVSSALILGK